VVKQLPRGAFEWLIPQIMSKLVQSATHPADGDGVLAGARDEFQRLGEGLEKTVETNIFLDDDQALWLLV
jgi:hypothetical protein